MCALVVNLKLMAVGKVISCYHGLAWPGHFPVYWRRLYDNSQHFFPRCWIYMGTNIGRWWVIMNMTTTEATTIHPAEYHSIRLTNWTNKESDKFISKTYNVHQFQIMEDVQMSRLVASSCSLVPMVFKLTQCEALPLHCFWIEGFSDRFVCFR